MIKLLVVNEAGFFLSEMKWWDKVCFNLSYFLYNRIKNCLDFFDNTLKPGQLRDWQQCFRGQRQLLVKKTRFTSSHNVIFNFDYSQKRTSKNSLWKFRIFDYSLIFSYILSWVCTFFNLILTKVWKIRLKVFQLFQVSITGPPWIIIFLFVNTHLNNG